MKNIYFKKVIALIIFLLIIFCVYPSSTGFKKDSTSLVFNEGDTLYVGGSGEGNYSSIQSAINDANPGDTVFVFDDSSPYYENLFLNKSLSLVGEDKDSTVVDADEMGSVVEIYADGCLVSGFTLKNCKEPIANHTFSVVKIIDSDSVTVSNNILSIDEMEYSLFIYVVWLKNSCYCNISGNIIFELNRVQFSSGVYFSENSSFNNISGNIISNYTNGIRFKSYSGCNGNIIIGNHISNSSNYGICYSGCDGNIIIGNHIGNSRFGIDIADCNYDKIMNNVIEYNSAKGISLIHTQQTVISGNIIQYNGMGYESEGGIILLLENCCYNTVSGNIISNNNPTGIFVCYAFDNIIKENNFIDNYGPTDGSPEKWWGNAYFGLPFMFKSLFHANGWDGNFWSDYKGSGVKIIPGDIEILVWMFGWFQFDWHPAKEPYDIKKTN